MKILSSIFRYRGRKIRYSSRHLLAFYKVLFLMPFLAVLGYFVGYKQIYSFVSGGISEWQVYVFPILLIVSVLVLAFVLASILIRFSVLNAGYFSKVEHREILARMIIENGYFVKKQSKKGDGKAREKIIFPRIYYKSGKNSIFVSFETAGNKFQEKFETIGGFLETAFHADNISKVDEKGFIIYELVVEVYSKKISIRDMEADNGKVQLMKGLYWEFNKDPHLLLGGGTGGGKTFTILSLIYALCRVADIEICDPKNSDLMALGRLPIFEGKVHTGRDIVSCIENAVQVMDERFDEMNSSPDYRMGENYAYYGLKPKFVIVDEFAAFKAELGNDYKTEAKVDEYLTQAILKGRQAGVFFIVAMQRPDGEFIKTALRDNFMFRMSVGRLSLTGFYMIFGDENKDKKFKYVEKVSGIKVYGRGYVARGGEVAREFYSPQVPRDFDFIEEFVKINNELGFSAVDNRLKVEVAEKISTELKKEGFEEEVMVESDEMKLDVLDQMDSKY